MAKKESRNFRLDGEVLEMIRQLSEEWHVSQAQVIEHLVREAIEQDKTLTLVRREA